VWSLQRIVLSFKRFITVLWTKVYLGEFKLDAMPLAVHFHCPHSHFSRCKRKSSWNYRAQCNIIPLHQILKNCLFCLIYSFYQWVQLSHQKYPVYSLRIILCWQCWTACIQRAMRLLLNTNTVAGYVTGSLYRNVTGILGVTGIFF